MKDPLRFAKPPWIHIGALIVFVFLVLFDFTVLFDVPAAYARNPQETYGTRFVAARSDIWNCFRLRNNIQIDLGIITAYDRCQERYLVVVQTEVCMQSRSEVVECRFGTWRWTPNPPCGGDSPTGWYLPPC